MINVPRGIFQHPDQLGKIPFCFKGFYQSFVIIFYPFLSLTDRPSPPGRPEAVDRDMGALSKLAYLRAENDALLLRWEEPHDDGGTPVTGR